MLPMLLSTLGVYENVSDEHYNKEVQIEFEHTVHQIYKCFRGISQSKLHE